MKQIMVKMLLAFLAILALAQAVTITRNTEEIVFQFGHFGIFFSMNQPN